MFVLPCLLNSYFVQAQDYSSRGTDFWVGYGAHNSMYNVDGTININGGTQEMVLYFSCNRKTNITVEIPATGWQKTYTANGNGIAESDPLPKTGVFDSRLGTEGVSNKGIHIISDQPILAYSHIYDNGSSATTLLFPTNILGQDYKSLNFTQISRDSNSHSYCFVVATEDSTVVEVTPSANTQNHLAGATFTQTLQRGEVLTLMGEQSIKNGNNFIGGDLTGTRIRTVRDDTSICKRIAVFCGSTSVAIDCNEPGSATSDIIFQQMFPGNAMGKKYIVTPTKFMNNNILRIMVNDTSTIVTDDGVALQNLINKKYYQININKPSIIEADKNIMVAQFITSSDKCNNLSNTIGDPEMIYLSPVVANINHIVINSPGHSGNITSHYINAIIKTSDTSSFLLDNTTRIINFSPIPYDSSYSYAQFNVTEGTHSLQSDSGFNAIAYGYGNFESYGYNVGFSNKPLDALTIQNPYAVNKDQQTCNATPFKISITLSYQAASIQWNFFNNLHLFPNTLITKNNPVEDSSFFHNGSINYVYKLVGFYNYDTTGSFLMRVTTTSPTQDGCISKDSIDYNIDVFQKPVADWILNDNTCLNDTLQFFDSSRGFERSIVQWNWKFGNGDTSGNINPSEAYTVAGNYNVQLRAINDIGCYADTSKPIFISSIPVAKFGISGVECVGNGTSFSDSSRNVTGNIVKWNWDFGDGSTSAFQNPFKFYKTQDTFNVKLLVYTAQNCVSDTSIKRWQMYYYPKVSTPTDLFVEEGNSVQIKPEYEGNGLRFLWTPSLYLDNDTIAFPVSTPKTGIFYHEIITGDGGCSIKGGVYIDVIKFLEIPNAFSPNGDGINDTWIISNIERYPQCNIQVFNRYGQHVFLSKGYYKPWDGTINGKSLPVGIYYYIIDTKDKFVPVKSGYVTILK